VLVGYLASFFLLIFLAALCLAALFLARRERSQRARSTASGATRLDLPLSPSDTARSPGHLSEFERSVLRQIHGMSNEEIEFSEALLQYGAQRGRVYITSNERSDGFFQC